MKMKGEACLQADDFVALRSLARYGRWEQGRRLMWRFARHEGWESVQYDQCPALDAAERLERAGLVEEAVCHCGCMRDIIQLTERGKTFVERMDRSAVAIASQDATDRAELAPVVLSEASQRTWLFSALRAVFKRDGQ